MPLVDSLRRELGDAEAGSFQLMGEDLILVAGPDLEEAARAYRERLEANVPAELRAPFEAEQRAFSQRANHWLRRFNRNVFTRVRGYVGLGRLCRFEYPWPVVAVLGICTVIDGMGTTKVWGLVGRAAARFGSTLVERLSEQVDDVLRRTNRGIFADSVPLVLYALRCHELRCQGDQPLAEALLSGPLPPVMDEESRALASQLYEALGLKLGPQRFRTLADLTLTHFDREQAIFTHQFGLRRGPASLQPYRGRVEARLANPKTVVAPSVKRVGLRKKKRKVAFGPHRLPDDFDFREHARRVREFGKLYVSSITRDVLDYQAAVEFVLQRFGQPGERFEVVYGGGGARAPRPELWTG